MHKLLLLFLFCPAAVFCRAQEYKLLSDHTGFKQAFTEASAKVNTIASDFTQVKHLSLLAEKITSKGKFYFKKSNLVRMQYTTPYQYLMILNGAKINIQDGQKTTSVSAKSNKMFQQLNQLMLETVQGNVFDNKNFTTRIFESSVEYLVEMTPVTAQMKNMFSKVNVIMAKTSFVVNRVQLFEPGGDYTAITYSNQQINLALPDALFAVR